MVVMKLEKAIFLEAQYNFKHKYWKLRFCKFGFCLLIITAAMTVENCPESSSSVLRVNLAEKAVSVSN